MRTLLPIFVLALCASVPASGQAIRFDSTATTTSAQCVSGKQCPLLVLPGTQVNFCQGTPSTVGGCLSSPATTYTSQAASVPCSTTAQLTPGVGGACLSTADAQGGYGAWLLPGSYSYYLRVPITAGGGTYGPYVLSIHGDSGGYTLDSLYSTLAQACTAAGSGTLAITKRWNSTPTQSMSCAAWFLSGGVIQPASGQTVTLTGTVKSPVVQIFDTSLGGDVEITSSSPAVYPQWWGAKGDGAVNDSSAIQSAIRSICSTGGSLQFTSAPQYYMVTTGALITGCRDILITGATGTEIRVQSGYPDTPYTSWPNFGKDSIFRILDSSNITIEGLTLNGNISNRTAYGPSESENCVILVAGSTNVRIRRNVLKEGMTDGVLTSPNATGTSNTNVWIEDSQILNNRRNNLSLVAQNGLWIARNQISGAGTIQGTNPKSGIDVEPDTTTQTSFNVHITDNNITTSAGTYAVNVVGTASGSFTGNHIYANAATAVNFQAQFTGTAYRNTDWVFASNNIYDNPNGFGIRLVGRNLDQITGNLFRNNQVGVGLYLPDGLLVNSNTFDGNQYYAITNDASYGFTNLTIANNVFRDNLSALGVANGASGAAFTGTPLSSTALLLFSDNLMYGTQSPVTATSPSGIHLTAVCQCRANGNTAYGLNSPLTSFTGLALGSGNHNFDLTGALIRYADAATGGANFSANNGGGPLYVTERRVDVTNTGVIPVTTCLAGDMAWNGSPSTGQPRGWYCSTIGNVWTSMGTLP